MTLKRLCNFFQIVQKVKERFYSWYLNLVDVTLNILRTDLKKVDSVKTKAKGS